MGILCHRAVPAIGLPITPKCARIALAMALGHLSGSTAAQSGTIGARVIQDGGTYFNSPPGSLLIRSVDESAELLLRNEATTSGIDLLILGENTSRHGSFG